MSESKRRPSSKKAPSSRGRSPRPARSSCMGRVEGDLTGPSVEVTESGVLSGKAKVTELRSRGELAGEFDAEGRGAVGARPRQDHHPRPVAGGRACERDGGPHRDGVRRLRAGGRRRARQGQGDRGRAHERPRPRKARRRARAAAARRPVARGARSGGWRRRRVAAPVNWCCQDGSVAHGGYPCALDSHWLRSDWP